MILKDLTSFLESIAPLSYQEDYDNSGLLVGNPMQEIHSAIISLDCTEVVVDEAIQNKANLIISHHPIVFSGLKRFNGNNYIERVVMKAIKHDIALYAIHTNLDNVQHGVNAKIAEKLGLINCRILAPKAQLIRKLVTFVPVDHAEKLKSALFNAGAGEMGNYSECSFFHDGTGSFKGGEGSHAFVGELGKRHLEKEERMEVVYNMEKEGLIIKTLKENHPYEIPAFDLFRLENKSEDIGSGMIGELENGMEAMNFLTFLKEQMQTPCIKYTELIDRPIKKIALCGGSGSFLLKDAIASKADIYITADYKYHQFFDADGQIMIADIGHYESEQFTKELLLGLIQKKFPTFALQLTKINTNPVHYFC